MIAAWVLTLGRMSWRVLVDASSKGKGKVTGDGDEVVI